MVLHSRLCGTEIREQTQLLKIQINKTVEEAQRTVQPDVQLSVTAGGLGGVAVAADAKADIDLRDAQRPDDRFRQL